MGLLLSEDKMGGLWAGKGGIGQNLTQRPCPMTYREGNGRERAERGLNLMAVALSPMRLKENGRERTERGLNLMASTLFHVPQADLVGSSGHVDERTTWHIASQAQPSGWSHRSGHGSNGSPHRVPPLKNAALKTDVPQVEGAETRPRDQPVAAARVAHHLVELPLPRP